MIIIACLGNPGRKYKKNRHNVGVMCGDHIMDTWGTSRKRKAFSSVVFESAFEGKDTLFLFPLTYMNNSGQAVSRALDYYRVEPVSLIVIHDDIDLSLGEVREKFSGGHRGQNGVRSIMQEVGSPDFYRIRLGVGRPENPHVTVADYVLSDFTSEERQKLPDMFSVARSMTEEIIKG